MTSNPTSTESIKLTMLEMGQKARRAARNLAKTFPEMKQKALTTAAKFLRQNVQLVLAANQIDLATGEKNSLSPAMLDRLKLDEIRVMAVADSLDAIAKLDDPVGQVIGTWDRPNGLKIERVRTPLGVVGVIYESRPKRYCRCGSTLPKSRKRRDPTWRKRFSKFVPRDSQLFSSRARVSRASGGINSTRFNNGSGGCR